MPNVTLESLANQVAKFAVAIDARVDSLGQALTAQLDSVDQRLDSADHRLDSVDHRLDSVDQRLDSVDQRLGSVDHRLDRIESKLDQAIRSRGRSRRAASKR